MKHSRTPRRPRRRVRRGWQGALVAMVVLIGATVALPPLVALAAGNDGSSTADKPTIALIGAGHVGQALGGLWAAAGYHVIFATRHPDQLGDVVRQAGHGATASAVGPAVKTADIITLAVPYKAEPAIARQYGPAMRGKILVDVDNAFAGRDGAVAKKAEAVGEAQYSARLFAGTRFVRAFNMIGAGRYPEPGDLDSADFDVVYTTNDDTTRATAEALIRATGGTPVYKGGLANAPEYSF